MYISICVCIEYMYVLSISMYTCIMCHVLSISMYTKYNHLLVSSYNHVLSQVTLPCALKHHEALCCPALAILVPVMPRDQPNGAKLREPPASKRLHEPTRTSARPVPQLCPKRASTTHHYPPSEPAREPGQPRTEAGRRARPASYYYYSC